MQLVEQKLIRGVKKVYGLLKQFNFATQYDKVLTFYNFNDTKLKNAKLFWQKYDDGMVVATCYLTFETNSNQLYRSEKQRIVSYPDGLTYYVHSRVLASNNSELYLLPEPANALFSFANSDYIQFRFIRFDIDVSLNFRMKHQILLTLQNYISNYLMNLGLSCVANPVMNIATISIFASSANHNRIYDYLSALDWYQILSPFKHLFSKLVFTTDSNEKSFELNPMIPNELKITLSRRGVTENDVIIKIDFNDSDYLKNVCRLENSYDIIDGWSLFPHLKTIYTNKRFTSNPVNDFVVFGKVFELVIHEKYLPFWRASVLRVFGVRINGIEYWFNQPIYADRFYHPCYTDAEKWNTYLAGNL